MTRNPHLLFAPLAKQTRLPFPQSTSRANKVFDLIRGDVSGPYRIPTYDGNRYFLTLVDDCSRMVWIFLLKMKSDVSIILKDFLNIIHRQFDGFVKVFRSDSGPEFFNSYCMNCLEMQALFIRALVPTHPAEWVFLYNVPFSVPTTDPILPSSPTQAPVAESELSPSSPTQDPSFCCSLP